MVNVMMYQATILIYGLNLIQIVLLILTSLFATLAIYFKIQNTQKRKEQIKRKEAEKEIFNETKDRRMSIGSAESKFEDYYMNISPPRPLQKIPFEAIKRAKQKRQVVQEKKALEKEKLKIKHKKNRLVTGISELDYLLYGGLPNNYSIDFLAPSSDEKELILAKIVKTAINSKMNVIYTNNKILPFYKKILDKDTKYFNVVFCGDEEPGYKRSIRSDEGITSLNLAIARMLNDIKGDSLIILDNLSQLLLSDKANAISEFLKSMNNKLKSKSITFLATLNPDMIQKQIIAQISELFDCEIELYKKKDQDKKFIRVNKLSGKKYKDEILQIKRDELVKELRKDSKDK